MDDVAGVDRPLAAGRGRVGHHEGAGRRVDPERQHLLGGRAVLLEPHQAARGHLPGGPVVDREATRAQGLHARLEAREEPVEQQGAVDRPAPGGLAEARHQGGDRGREVGPRPARVDADSHRHPRVAGPEAVGLAEDAAELAERPAAEPDPGDQRSVLLHHEIVRPLQADRPVAEAGELLGSVGHGEAHDRRQPPDMGRCEPRGPEADGQEERSTGRRGPRPAGPPASGGLLVGHGQADLRRPRGQPGADRVVRRADPREPLLPGEERHRLAAAPSTGSGVASSKVAWRARTAVSSCSSATVQVIRTSDVEIISMFTPALLRAPNIRAA